MKKIKEFEGFLSENEKPKISSAILRSVLWEKGWKQYWEAHDKLSKILDKYRSVSDLPDGTDEKTLENLSGKLINLAFEINKFMDEKH